MGHKASKVCDGPPSRDADRKSYVPQNNLYLRKLHTYSTEPERGHKNFGNSNNSNELNSILSRTASSFDETTFNPRFPSNRRLRRTPSFRPKEVTSSRHNSLDMMKKVVLHADANAHNNSNHSSESRDGSEDSDSSEKFSVSSCTPTPTTSNARKDNLKDRRSKSVSKGSLHCQDEPHMEKCLFNVLHRKESQRFCRAVSKNLNSKSNRDTTGTIVLSDGRLYNRTQELVKDTRKNVEFASERVHDFKRLAATLEQMDASLQTLPKRLANGFSKILDFDVFSEVDESLQMEIISTAKNSCSLLSDTIPSLQKHIENIRDIQMILIRTEERLDTFCKALYQMFHLPDFNASRSKKHNSKRDFLKTAFKTKKS